MAKNKVLSSKKLMKATTEPGLSENQASDDDMDGEDIQREIKTASKLLASALLQFEERVPRSTVSRSNVFLTQRKTAYAQARKNAQEIVQVGVSTLESIRAQLEELRGRELGLQNHREDCSLPSLTHQKILQDMDEVYTPLLKELGPTRSEQVNEANRMLRNNDDHRQEALENSSRRARHQLELTRQMEKDAVDAKELIAHTKNLLRMKPGRKGHGKRNY